jgi:hypothetical protein
MQLQQLQPIKTDKPLEWVEIMMSCPQAAALYYTACGRIDQHNLCRQSGLDFEKKTQTKLSFINYEFGADVETRSKLAEKAKKNVIGFGWWE